MRSEGVQRATAKPSARLRRGETLLLHIILFSLKTIALPRSEVSLLRARPKGFPIALWKPSGRPFDAMLLSTFMRKKVSRQRKKRVVMQWRNRREQPPGASCSCISCCPTECLRHGAGGRRRALGRNCRQGRHPRPGCACGSRG